MPHHATTLHLAVGDGGRVDAIRFGLPSVPFGGKGGRGRGYAPSHWAEDLESQLWHVAQRRTARQESGLGP